MYKIIFTKSSTKSFLKIDKENQKKISAKLTKISRMQNPDMLGKALLGNKKGLWRFRIENYRVICQMKKEELIILIVDVGHRKKIYKD